MNATKRKVIIMGIIMCVTAATFLCSTFAYFSDSLTSGGSVIYTGTTSAVIIDNTVLNGEQIPANTPIRIMPGQTVSKSVTAKNTGTLPVYVRIKLNSDITLSGNAVGRETEIDTSLISYDIDTEHWTYSNGYYYYNFPLTAGKQSPDLFTQVKFSEKMDNLYKDGNILFTVRVEIVQASGNGSNAMSAVGWIEPTSEGGNA